MRKSPTPWEPVHRASLRHRVAVEAARLLYTREYKEYFQAKREAARRQGSKHLPGNREIHEQLLLLAQRLEPHTYAQKLQELRQDALTLMECLKDFHPHLIGSVWTGHIRQGSDIDLNVYSHDRDTVQLCLEGYQVEAQTVRSRKQGEPQEFFHLHVSGGGLRAPAEITVYPWSERHQRGRCGITGGPIRRASLAQLQQLLAQASPLARCQELTWKFPLGPEEILERIPELAGCRQVLQNHFHHLDVYEHTLAVVRGLEELIASHFERLQPWSSALQESLDIPLLILAALCHDLGKPQTQSFSREGRIRFLGHELVGAGLASQVAQRLQLSPERSSALVKLVRWHLEAVLIPAQDQSPSRIHRLFRQLGPRLPELAVLSLADVEASLGPAQSQIGLDTHFEFVQFLLQQHFEQGFLANPSLPVSAHDLEEVVGIRQPKLQQSILDWLTERFVEGEFESQEEALSMVDEFLCDPRRRIQD